MDKLLNIEWSESRKKKKNNIYINRGVCANSYKHNIKGRINGTGTAQGPSRTREDPQMYVIV